MQLLIAIFIIVIAVNLWGIIFWLLVTRSKKDKSWTLLSEVNRRSFLIEEKIIISLIWIVTYIVYTEMITPNSDVPAIEVTFLKIALTALSLIWPTYMAHLDLRYRIAVVARY